MRQQDATPQRPFYSVTYQYERNPWTNYSFNEFYELLGGSRTMPGTDDEALARKAANHCVKQPGVAFAYVAKTEDCYNHSRIYTAKSAGNIRDEQREQTK